jgi:hypothetical protein
MKLAADIVEHKGPGQRRNRNRLAFLAADQAALEDIQSAVRKKLAWASIVRDARGILQLPPAQEDDAKKKLAEQETAALNAVRRGWKHMLLPQEPQPASPNAARGFDLEPVALTNRGSDPMPLAQLAWKKCEDDGLIVSRLGVLDNDLGKVWQPTQPHVSVRQLRDWFRNSRISLSCGSRRSWLRPLARRWRAQTPSMLLRTASTRPRESMSA